MWGFMLLVYIVIYVLCKGGYEAIKSAKYPYRKPWTEMTNEEMNEEISRKCEDMINKHSKH